MPGMIYENFFSKIPASIILTPATKLADALTMSQWETVAYGVLGPALLIGRILIVDLLISLALTAALEPPARAAAGRVERLSVAAAVRSQILGTGSNARHARAPDLGPWVAGASVTFADTAAAVCPG